MISSSEDLLITFNVPHVRSWLVPLKVACRNESFLYSEDGFSFVVIRVGVQLPAEVDISDLERSELCILQNLVCRTLLRSWKWEPVSEDLFLVVYCSIGQLLVVCNPFLSGNEFLLELIVRDQEFVEFLCGILCLLFLFLYNILLCWCGVAIEYQFSCGLSWQFLINAHDTVLSLFPFLVIEWCWKHKETRADDKCSPSESVVLFIIYFNVLFIIMEFASDHTLINGFFAPILRFLRVTPVFFQFFQVFVYRKDTKPERW